MYKVVWYEPKKENPSCLRMLERDYRDAYEAFLFFEYLTTCDDVSSVKLKKVGK